MSAMPAQIDPPRSEPPFSGVIALLTIARVWDAELASALRELGLSTRKYGLLGHVKGSPGISFSELARRSRITVQSAHTAIGSLVESGWVRDASAQPGAASVLRLTEAGQALMARAAAALSAVDARLDAQHPDLVTALRAELARRGDARAEES
jgi:DNA-binding MarR family transcriptional regulator